MSIRARLERARVDLTPARRSRDFRILLVAGTVFYFGSMVAYVAVPFQIYRLTGSNLAVGVLGLVQLGPLIVSGLWGGALADHVDRRRLLIWCGVGQVVLMGVLSANALLGTPRLPVIYAASALVTVVGALQRPSREALLPRTVRHDEIPAANSLMSLGFHVGVFAGPALGGVIVATAGAAWCFALTALVMAVATVMYALMRPYAHREETTRPSFAGIAEGWRYAVGRRDLLGTYLVDIAAMFLAMPVVLFPAFAESVFQRPELLGALYTAETAGALVSTALSGWMSRVTAHGRLIVIAAAAYGVFIALAGLAPTIWLAMLALAAAGAADNVSAILRGTVWNQSIPERMRGRLAGIEMLSYSVGPLAGQVRAGLVADRWSVRSAITSGGILCVGGVAVTALWLRDFWHYDAATDPHVLAERERRAAYDEVDSRTPDAD